VSLIAVLIPLLFMGDIVGRLFREFAVTLSVTIIVSAFVSLTLTPMMSSKLLKHTPESERGRFYRWSEAMFEWTIAKYGVGVKFVLRHQWETLFVAVGTLVATIMLYIYIPKGFFPVEDTGAIVGITQAPQSISFAAMGRRQQELAKIIVQDPAVQDIASFIGVDGTNTVPNSGRIQITLKPLDDRDASATQVIQRLNQKVSQVAGIQLYMQQVQDLTVENRVSATQYQFTLEGPDASQVDLWAPRLLQKISQIPEVRDAASDQQSQGLGLLLTINRDTASRLGILPQNIDDTLYDAFGQRQISTIFTQLNQYHVVLETTPAWQQNFSGLRDLYVQTPSGTEAPLNSFVTAKQMNVPVAINHQGQFPVVTLSFNLAPGASLGTAVDHIHAITDQMGMPASLQTAFQGTAAAFEASLSNEPILILAAIVTVYIVLGVLYESYIHPITILSTLPSAGVGALLALMLTGQDLNVIALIGIILLIGIVKKNAIMMIDFALERERVEGKSPEESIYEACLLRFRPIMMTTMAALLGAVPLAFGSGTGAELRRPLGITIIGGLLLSQLLTLFTTPVVYLMFDRLAHRFGSAPELSPADEGPVPEAS